jgi:hypothetical protein
MNMEKIDPVLNRDLTAALLSVVPGTGHLYKHHLRAGMLMLIPGNLIAVVATGLMVTANLGAAIFVAPAFWVAWCIWGAFEAPEGAHHAGSRA